MAKSPTSTLFGEDTVPSTGPPKGELGAVTQQVGGPNGWASFVDEMEYVPELSWPQSILTYHRMRSDSQVEALHEGTTKPVREFRWSIDPNEADSKLVEQVATDFGLPIRGEEDAAIKRSRTDFDFDTFLGDALLSLDYGHFHFEVVGDVVEGDQWRLQKLGPRHPRTLADFKQTATGELEAIRQNIPGSDAADFARLPPPIPANRLIPFVWRPEAGSLVGRPMLRAIYREWLVKDRTMRVAAINLERGSGVPVIEAAPGSSDAQIRDLAELARQFKVAEGGGGAIPFGAKLTLVGGNVPQAIDLLKYCDECMARVWALMLVQLGMTATGNRALGAEFAVYAARAQRAIAKWIAAQVNKFLDRYTEWNDPFAAYAPLLHFEQSKPDSMSITDFVSLVQAKALIVDPELEEWIRAEHGLPEYPSGLGRTPTPTGGTEDANPSLPSPTLDPTSQSPTLASAATGHPSGIERVHRGVRASLTLPARELRRAPNEGEIRAAVDFAGLDTAHKSAHGKLWQAFRTEVIPEQIKSVGDQIRGLDPTQLTRSQLTKLAVPPLGHEALEEHLLAAAQSGASTARRELEAQGVDAVSVTPEQLVARVADQAMAMAEMSANGLALAAQRKAQSLVSTSTVGRDPEQLAGDVEGYLSDMQHVWTRDQLQGAVTFAQNQGRIATFTESAGETEPTYQASELLDERTCEPCAAIDGTVFDSLEEAEAAYASGGYTDCEGGPNCRGTLVAVHDEQNPASTASPVGEEGAEPERPASLAARIRRRWTGRR